MTLTDAQREVAAARLAIARRYDEWLALQKSQGKSEDEITVADACADLRLPRTTLDRVLSFWLPNRNFNDLIPGKSSGRPRKWEAFAARAEVRERLQKLYLLSCGASSEYMTNGRRTGSFASTLKVFSRDPLCDEPELALELRRGAQPVALVRVIREITDNVEQRSRGPRHSMLNGNLSMSRNLIEVLSHGGEQEIAEGDWWTMDDMSDNMPHWWTGPGNEPLIGRQGLYAWDLGGFLKPNVRIPGRWLGVDKLGTVRDAYTAAIILRTVRRFMEIYGKPRRGIVLELSVWKARTITGSRITSAGQLVDDEIERPAMDEKEKTELEQGLRNLGILLVYTHTPRGKEIEGSFNQLQRLKPMIASQWKQRRRNGAPGPEPLNIGRHAGEYEYAAKQLRRVRARSHHPADLGFLHLEDSLDIDLETMAFIDGERIPYPKLAPLADHDYAVFLPEKRQLQIRDGKVVATVDGQALEFCAPELFASLGSGYRLTVAFDPSEPTLGAAIYNRETSSVNFNGWRLDQYIGHASFLDSVARFDWRSEREEPAEGDPRKRFAKHVRTAFGAVGLTHRVSQAMDGRGNVATVANASANTEPRTPEAAPRQRVRSAFAAPSESEFERRAASLAREAAMVRGEG